MDWLIPLGLGLMMAEKSQKKEEERHFEQISDCRSEIFHGIDELNDILLDLADSCLLSIEQNDLDNMKELAPLFPLEEVLSLQGYIGTEQRLFLRDYFNLTRPRYNVGQFTELATKRVGDYGDWRRLSGLEGMYCGQIWHTMIELVCRRRTPDTMQQVVDALGKILYYFWFLENGEMVPAKIRYTNIISDLNIHAAEYQKTPYLRAVMLLQVKLAEKYGGDVTDYEPCLDSDQTCDMDGKENLCFWVRGKDPSYFVHFYAVRVIKSPEDLDLIWELPAGGGAPEVFFAE